MKIVVGTNDERGRKVMSDIYRPLSLSQVPIMFTTRRTAEMIKYAANAFLATKITFINEIADLYERVGANVRSRAGSAWTIALARSSCMPVPASVARAFQRTRVR